MPPPIPYSTSWRVLKNAIFAQFKGPIILKVYKISQRNLSYSEAKAYIYTIKKSTIGKLIPFTV